MSPRGRRSCATSPSRRSRSSVHRRGRRTAEASSSFLVAGGRSTPGVTKGSTSRAGSRRSVSPRSSSSTACKRRTPIRPRSRRQSAAMDAGLAAITREGGQAPRHRRPHLDQRSTSRRARVAAEDGRRAIALAREHAARFGVRPETLGMIGFSAGAFLAVDVALDPRAEQLALDRADLWRRNAGRAGARRRSAALHRRRPGRHPREHRRGSARRLGCGRVVHRRSTPSPAAPTASAWSSRAFRPTVGPTSSSRGSTTSARRHSSRHRCNRPRVGHGLRVRSW